MAPPRILRWLTAAISLTAVGAGTVALHEQRVADDLARRCATCGTAPDARADALERLEDAQTRYAGLRARYEARVRAARRDEAVLLAAYARTLSRTHVHHSANVVAGA